MRLAFRNVSIHAPAREATLLLRFGLTPEVFQSTPPHGRRPRLTLPFLTTLSFNPRPRTGGDVGPLPGFRGYEVSIHAPAREATDPADLCDGPRWFQSTPPHGRRPAADAKKITDNVVSIHAPAREATDTEQPTTNRVPVSIHAPAREATTVGPGKTTMTIGFNPRPRTGGDKRPTCGICGTSGFNPRPRTGGDLRQTTTSSGWWSVSIHAPAREATGYPRNRRDATFVSIHAPAREATSGNSRCRRGRYVSIHAPAREATIASGCVSAALHCFNPRPRTGGDARSPLLSSAVCSFNPRPRTGGDLWGMQGDTVQDGFNPRPRTGGDF